MSRLAAGAAVFALAFALAVWAFNIPPPPPAGSWTPPPTYSYPTPSWWPSGPVSPGQPRAVPSTSVTCPPWAPHLIRHADGSYECVVPVPPPAYIVNPCPDPGQIVTQGPDGTMYCRGR